MSELVAACKAVGKWAIQRCLPCSAEAYALKTRGERVKRDYHTCDGDKAIAKAAMVAVARECALAYGYQENDLAIVGVLSVIERELGDKG